MLLNCIVTKAWGWVREICIPLMALPFDELCSCIKWKWYLLPLEWVVLDSLFITRTEILGKKGLQALLEQVLSSSSGLCTLMSTDIYWHTTGTVAVLQYKSPVLQSTVDVNVIAIFGSSKYMTDRKWLHHYKGKVMKVSSGAAKKCIFHLCIKYFCYSRFRNALIWSAIFS